MVEGKNNKQKNRTKYFLPGGKKQIQAVCAFLFLGVLILSCGVNLMHKDRQMSEKEMRMLEQKPEISLSGIASGRFMEQYEEYVSDIRITLFKIIHCIQILFQITFICHSNIFHQIMILSFENTTFFCPPRHTVRKCLDSYPGISSCKLIRYILLVLLHKPSGSNSGKRNFRFLLQHTVLAGCLMTGLFVLCVAYLVTESYNPFLYFRF